MLKTTDLSLTCKYVQRLANKQVIPLKLIRTFCTLNCFDHIETVDQNLLKLTNGIAAFANKLLMTTMTVFFAIHALIGYILNVPIIQMNNILFVKIVQMSMMMMMIYNENQ